MKKIISIIGTAALMLTISTSAFAEDNVDYKDWYSNSDISIDKTEDNQYIIQDNEKHQSFLLDEVDETMYVTATKGLNVRAVPTTDSKPLDTFTYGEEVNVIGSKAEDNDNEWVLIEYDSNFAFVWSEYLTTDAPKMNPSLSYYDEHNVSNEESSSSNMTYLGNYMCTAYEWTGSPCANGNYPTEGYTVACNSLPFGTQIYIDGYGYYTVEDRGGGGDNWIDIYMGDESSCYDFGVRYLDIYLVN
jgi:3D (Asp-Asp-Asp) domain-containing protein